MGGVVCDELFPPSDPVGPTRSSQFCIDRDVRGATTHCLTGGAAWGAVSRLKDTLAGGSGVVAQQQGS